MKNLRLLFVAQLLIVSFAQIVLSQVPLVSDAIPRSEMETLSAEELKKLQRKEFQPPNNIEDSPDDPLLSQINFDDLNIVTNNTVQIAPNRYPGVTFYHPTYGTWLTRAWSSSYPNSLAVGFQVVGSTEIFSPDEMHIEFAQPSKDIEFLWGHDQYYSAGQILIYGENNQLITTLTLNLGAYFWYTVSLNQYHQRIKKLVLRRPSVSNNQGFGHILLDNFRFTPVTTRSPIGHLDPFDMQQGAAVGWSLDPDSPSTSNYVHCYIGSTLIGGVLANRPSPDVPHPGNHRFSLPIPAQYRDGVPRQISCYGIDVIGGDPNMPLINSPRTYKANVPTGHLDSVVSEGITDEPAEDGDVTGWSKDLDLPDAPTRVHFYFNAPAPNGYYLGETTANIYRSDVGYHGYSFSIPPEYHDGVTRDIYAYGIDLNGDQNTRLIGSPKSIKINPKVQFVTFQPFVDATHGSSLSANPGNGTRGSSVGQRIFPDKDSPTDTLDRKTVLVKATISPVKANVTVYFKNYDLDDPSAAGAPIDPNGSAGNDNRGSAGTPPQSAGTLSAPSAKRMRTAWQPFNSLRQCSPAIILRWRQAPIQITLTG